MEEVRSFQEWKGEAGRPASSSQGEQYGTGLTVPSFREWREQKEAAEYTQEADRLFSQAKALESEAEEYNAMLPALVKPGEMDWSPEEIGAFQQQGFARRQQAQELTARTRELRAAAEAAGPRYAQRVYDAREQKAAYSPPDYAGSAEVYDIRESSHHSGTFGDPRTELPEAYREIPEKADYGEYSRYAPTGTGKKGMTWQEALLGQWLDTGYDDPVYEYINGNTDAINKVYSNESVSGSTVLGTDSRYLGNLNDTEKGVYNYLHYTQGKEAADQFLRDLQGELNARQRAKEEKELAEQATKNGWEAARMSAFSILTKPLSVFSYPQQTEKVLSGEELDPNAGYNRGSYTISAIRNAVSKQIEKSGKWGKVGSFGYNLGMSMGDFLYTSAITGGMIPSGGMEPLALAVMGTEAAADSVLAAKERGLSDERSFITGTIAGIIEAATERIGIDELFKTGIRGLGKKGFAKYILRNAGAEAAEEGVSDLLNWIVDDLYDLVTGTKESEFQALVAAYEENGLDRTKATLSALGDRGKELGLDTLGGFLSGLFLSGAKGGYNAAEFNRMGKEAFETGSYGDYISLGLLADRDTEACRYAEEIRAKLNAGREVTNIEMGQLAAAVYAEALGVGEKRTAEEQEAPEDDLGNGVVDGEKDNSAFQRALEEELGLEMKTAASKETAGPIHAGNVTTIQHPYLGEVPIQAETARHKVNVPEGSIVKANEFINNAMMTAKKENVGFKAALKKLYRQVFQRNTGVPVSGMSFQGEPYLVSIGNKVPGKVISDPNFSAEKLALLDILPEIVTNADYVGSGEYDGTGKKVLPVTRYDYFETSVIIDGKDYIAKFDVEILPEINNYRTHQIVRVDLISP